MTPNNQDDRTQTNQTVRSVELYRLPAAADQARPQADVVVVEQPVTIMVEDVGSFTLMCTPSDLEALAVGFVYSEGLIDGIDDVVSVAVGKADPNVIGTRLHDPSRASVARNLIVTSSCGLCGARTIEKTLSQTVPCRTTLTVAEPTLRQATQRLRHIQSIFQATGGAQAAGIFGADAELLAVSEDIGRHNALDKTIGKCLLAGRATAGCGVALSGRVTFDMVAKAARAGIELIAAVSAPSSLAIEAAQRWNITLCGFVRSARTNVYTHPARISGLQRA